MHTPGDASCVCVPLLVRATALAPLCLGSPPPPPCVLPGPVCAHTLLARALPVQADRDILEHIVYDYNDTEMMEALRPSIEEAQPVQSQELALDYIGGWAGKVRLVTRQLRRRVEPGGTRSADKAHADVKQL